ncbi:hypothetical protein SAMN06265360_10629 [Haloechinothrix alba]|uniref:Uncharacterized protein n=1 Tax=Haloechinothrix alba TaxID=664784 RepID=A0A238WCC3_9PSEU|nr:hypothetical protein [Haloechinothrix alba]SNR44190.1 hypothetical protein SAMN06265360_10629 [Haloechinothrix alba]
MTYITRAASFDGVSVAANGSLSSREVSGVTARRVRLMVTSAGADVSVALEASPNNGGDWLELSSTSGGATGAQAVEEMPGLLLRMTASNANDTNSQNVTAYLLLDRD